MDDLVERLQISAKAFQLSGYIPIIFSDEMREAAARIEKLEAALREIVDLSKGMSYLLGFTPADIARKALEIQTYGGQQDDSALKADHPIALSAEDIRKMNYE